MNGFLNTSDPAQCCGCAACVQACAHDALHMIEDAEGFWYPELDAQACTNCGACHRVCSYEHSPVRNGQPVVVFGGHHRDAEVLDQSTSGGAFTALVEAWFNRSGKRVVYGAVAHGLEVAHEAAWSIEEAAKFRKSKYAQSATENTFAEIRQLLSEDTYVLFSGTPCQVAGLYAFLGTDSGDQLCTVEVICEGIPSPLYIRSYDEALRTYYGCSIEQLDYRCKDGHKWDFQVMETRLSDGTVLKQDRWFNPFWSIWLDHLMSRPSCYACPFATQQRVADITLGDLWGVHLYCPELYAENAGASLVLCNSDIGADIFGDALPAMDGHALSFEDALQYQSPLRGPIAENEARAQFFDDMRTLDFDELNERWARKPTMKLLAQKYVWGNRQKVLARNVADALKDWLQ